MTEKLKNCNNISDKLPKINKAVYVFYKDNSRFYSAKLKIYDPKMPKIDIGTGTLKEGDIYWLMFHDREWELRWNTIDLFPYWMEIDDLLKLVIPQEKQVLHKSEILDIRE